MEFEWDNRKAAAKLAKYGGAFTEAAMVFGDPLSLSYTDPDHSDADSLHDGRLQVAGLIASETAQLG